MKLILASASPRRAEILRNAGFTFEIQPSHVDETRFPGENVEDYVRRLADAKARSAAQHAARKHTQAIVIGADTAVVVAGELLGKPGGVEDAKRMLRLLSGRTHEVLTSLAVLRVPEGSSALYVETTRVTFVELSNQDIDDYIATGEPFDKAGAYGIQGTGGKFVREIEGCYFNVMGLPLSRVWSLVRALESERTASA
ncbi:MAG: Maf family protein [Candidatus Acidiferrales bacterium]